ncbi:uncharacterized protein LOC135111230 isoform X1 [Scylla paramamosain]|uniref:uncharacterized protein LOC135111230 isoform X1 n=1 Tax=Scylla paramamosain TaxID=85552 RepID=UPI003083816A
MSVVVHSVRSAAAMVPRWMCVALLYTFTAVLGSAGGHDSQDKRSKAVWYRAKFDHEGSGLSNEQLRTVAAMEDMQHFRKMLAPILVPRVVGTEGHTRVRQHLVNTMNSLGWTVEEDRFDSNTPVGRKTFTNVIATLNPDAPRHLILACHYDSKLDREGEFIGATDSAVPCAMLLNLAFVMREVLSQHSKMCLKTVTKVNRRRTMKAKFKRRRRRKLKAKFKRRRKINSEFKRKKKKPDVQRNLPPGCTKAKKEMLLRKLRITSRSVNETWPGGDGGGPRDRHSWLRQLSYPFQPLRQLGRIKCCSDNGSQYEVSFIPSVQSDLTLRFIFIDGEEAFRLWSDTDSLYGARHMAANLEARAYPTNNAIGTNELHRMDLFVLLDLLGTADVKFFNYFEETSPWYMRLVSYERRLREMQLLHARKNYIFQNRDLFHAGIQDDHIPFLKRGVPVLHLIPMPFPKVWHKNTDREEALHYGTIESLNKLMRTFVADYLHLVL